MLSRQTGYLQGDPASGKLVPYYEATGSLTTVIGIENVYSSTDLTDEGMDDMSTFGDGPAHSINVQISVFPVDGVGAVGMNLCLPAYDFGFIVLQENPAAGAQQG